MKELNRISELDRIFKQLQPIKPESKLALDKKFRLEFNYNSNHLEGNTLTYGETEQLLIFDIVPKGDHSFREAEEMKGSDVAYKLIIDWANEQDRPLSEQQIKNLNQVLLVRPFWKEAITPDGQPTRRLIKVGDYKEFPNSVQLQNGEIFRYASPIDTPILMADLIKWFREEEEKKELHPAVLAALFHYKFVCIHPFDDGNGRISRLLMNYVLIRNGFPPVVIKSADKSNYLRALNRADTGDLDAFVAYILNQLSWSLELCIKAANGESLDEPGDLDKKIKVLKQKLNPNADSERLASIKKSREVVKNLFEESLKILLVQLNGKLEQLDSLFKNTYVYLYVDSQNPTIGFEKNLSKIESQLSKSDIGRITFIYVINDLMNDDQTILRSGLQLIFHENQYEISSSETGLYFTKSYNSQLSESEILSIIERIGTVLVERIDQLTQN